MPRPVPQPVPISVDVAIRGLQQKQLVCSRLKAELETAIQDLEEARRKRQNCEIALERDTAARAVKAREGFYTIGGETSASTLRADYQARMRYTSSDTCLTADGSLSWTLRCVVLPTMGLTMPLMSRSQNDLRSEGC